MKKKTISAAAAVMAVVIAFGAAAPCTSVVAEAVTSSSSAKSESAAKMEAALKTVKSRINIPEEFTEFSYSTRTEKAVEGYTFTWKAVDAAGEVQKTISVTIMGDVITRYNMGASEYSDEPTLAKLSREKIHEYAVSAIKALDPEIADQIEVSNDFNIDLHGDNAYISLKRRVNGLYLGKNTGSIVINKNTGEVTSFSLSWWSDAEFEDVSKAVDEKTMEQSYKDNVKLVPSYVINRAYDDKGNVTGKTAKLILFQDVEAVFDASTGKPTTMYDDYAKSYNTSNYSLYETVTEDFEEEDCVEEDAAVENPATGIGAGVELTAAEKQALIDSGKYYSKTEAVDILTKDKYLNIGDDYVMESGVFREGESPSGFVWVFSFYKNTEREYRSAYVTMDAETGRILSFNKYANAPTKTINIKTVNKIAEQAAEYYLSDIFGEYKSAESNTADANKQTSRNIIFERYANDIAVQGNNITINVNSDGEVMSFSYSYDEVVFPSADIISEEKAYEKAFSQTDFRLYYDGFQRLDGESRIYMLYTVDNFYLDAKTGKLCTSNGSPITAKEKTDGCPYTDIEGHWAEKYITTLYDYGIRLSTDSGDKFEPDEYITEREFSGLLSSVFYVNAIPLMYADYSYSKAAEFGNDKLTKANAAKEFVLCAGGKDFAEIKGIYKSPFKDVAPTRDDLGYIAIAYGMGAVKADSSGNFNPEGKLTRGYAMYMIYNYLKNNS